MRNKQPWILSAGLALSALTLACWKSGDGSTAAVLPAEETAPGSAVAKPASTHASGENEVTVRGKKQDVYFYPAGGQRLNHAVLFVPGDGGWHGHAVTIAQTMASWGYDVYGLDTKTYLESFTKGGGLRESDVPADFRQVAQWIGGGADARVTLVGWSEGANLCLLAAASDEGKKTFDGLATFGLSQTGILGWRWQDDLTYVTKKDPDEPTFDVGPYLPKVAPLPWLVLQSSHDEYVSTEEEKRLFASAREPKRFVLIEARNHRFDGNTEEFFKSLREGLAWVEKAEPGKS